MCDAEPFVFAGAIHPLDPARFAFLTCAPNTVVGEVHPKAMPVILHGAAKDAWLTGDAAEALAMPLADELMRIVQRHGQRSDTKRVAPRGTALLVWPYRD